MYVRHLIILSALSLISLALISTPYIHWTSVLNAPGQGAQGLGTRLASPIVFIGDSVTRYQYLSFAHYLTFGVYPKSSENWAEEKKWPGWTEFYRGTNAKLNSSPNAEELCDCYRNQGTTLNQIIENRKYSGPLDVYYFQFFRPEIPLKGHTGFLNGSAISCIPGMCDSMPVWEHSLVDTLKYIIRPLQPAVVIVNSGLHSSTNMWSEESLHSFLNIMEEFPLPIWKTTTHRKGEVGRPITDCLMLSSILLEKRNVTIFDAYEITSRSPFSETWDTMHFYSPTYEILNSELIALLNRHGMLLPSIRVTEPSV